MDSEWVAPILLVPKKIGIMLEEIQNDAYENARIYKEKTKSVNTQEKYIYIYIYIWIDFLIGSDAISAADFLIGSDTVFVKKKLINLRSWEGGVKSVLDRPKQG